VKPKKVNDRVIRRVLFYYEGLLKDSSPDEAYISSKRIQDITGISNNQIRQDLFYLGLSIGKQKKGYRKGDLLKELKKILKIQKGANLIVLGAGKLGRALASHKLLKARKINVKAFFDIKEGLVGEKIDISGEQIPVYDISYVEEFITQSPGIDIALLTVSEESSQEVFEKILLAGIRGVINYSPTILQIPKEIPAEEITLINDCLAISLYKVIYKLY
jgi:redox-sensing transcriptional repressor